MINKKGISPLIATVLIIGFTVALGAVIFIWGSNFFKETTENVDLTAKVQIACTNADFKILNCTLSKVHIENIGTTILKFKIRNTDDTGDTAITVAKPTLGLDSLEITNPGIDCPMHLLEPGIPSRPTCKNAITIFPVVIIDGVESDCTQAGKTVTCPSS